MYILVVMARTAKRSPMARRLDVVSSGSAALSARALLSGVMLTVFPVGCSSTEAYIDAATSGEPPLVSTARPSGPAPEGMVWIPGGEFSMGAEHAAFPDARPYHRV